MKCARIILNNLKEHTRINPRTIYPGQSSRSLIMPDSKKTKAELIEELTELRGKLSALEKNPSIAERSGGGLPRSASFLQTLMDTIPSPIFYKDRSGKYLGHNKAFREALGIDLVGGSVYDVAPKELADKYKQMDDDLFENPGVQIYDFDVKYTDGKLHKVIFNKATYTDDKGEVIGLVGVMTDITYRKRVEDAMDESRRMLRLILDTIPVRVFWKDLDLKYLGCNANFAKDAGLGEPDDLLGKDDFQMSWKNEAELYRSDDRSVIESGEAKLNYEEPQSRPDDTLLWLKTSKIPLRDGDGKVFGVLGTYEDITEWKLVKDEAVSANRAKTAFLTAMSHEIRTPLSVIIGAVEMIGETELDDEQRKYSEILSSAGSSLLGLVDKILDISKIEAGLVELKEGAFDVRASTEKLVKLLSLKCGERGLSLTSRVDDAVPPVLFGDVERLEEVLLNLLDNALKFTGKGGSIEVETLLAKGASSLTKTATKLHFSVKDTGTGIAPKVQSDVFDLFTQIKDDTTRRPGGTGLGLSISKRLVELMGGSIWVESAAGKGSAFHFTASFKLPKGAAAEKAAVKRPAEEGDRRPLKILLVEDSKDVRFVIKTFLKTTPYRVDTATQGSEAFEKFKGQSYDLVLMDLDMPVMDGYEATEKIREYEGMKGIKRTPVLALTAHALKDHKTKSREAGCDGHISKPINKAELLRIIREKTS